MSVIEKYAGGEWELPEKIYIGLKVNKIKARKTSSEQQKEWLRIRTRIQIHNPKGDPMTQRIFEQFTCKKDSLKGRIIDLGCYTGALYHWLDRPVDYTGIDIWKEAIEVAKEFAPEGNFVHQNLMDVEGHYDVVWCSQLVLKKNTPEIEKIHSLGDLVILI